MRHEPPDPLLADLLHGHTHARIKCTRCYREVIWHSRELIERLGGDRTRRDVQLKMKCTKCGCKGWTMIEPAGR